MKAEKGGVNEAEALMNLYIDDPPADMEKEQAMTLARKWYEAWIALLRARAEKGSVRARKKPDKPCSRTRDKNYEKQTGKDGLYDRV